MGLKLYEAAPKLCIQLTVGLVTLVSESTVASATAIHLMGNLVAVMCSRIVCLHRHIATAYGRQVEDRAHGIREEQSNFLSMR